MTLTSVELKALAERHPHVAAADALLTESGCLIKSWRRTLTGVASTKCVDWSIEVPRPTGPLSFFVFAHEVGHQVLHRRDRGSTRVPRWEEEVAADEYAAACFPRFELAGVTDALAWNEPLLAWALYKSLRRTAAERRPERLALMERRVRSTLLGSALGDLPLQAWIESELPGRWL